MIKKLQTLSLLAVLFTAPFGISNTTAQEITFTAENNGDYAKLDSIRITNLTQNTSVIVTWPDTVYQNEFATEEQYLFIGYTFDHNIGTNNPETLNKDTFQLNGYPNPTTGSTLLSITLPEKGTVHLNVTAISGQRLYTSVRELDKGKHTFKINPGAESIYIITANWKNEFQSFKLLSRANNTNTKFSLSYLGQNSGKSAPNKNAAVRGEVLESGIVSVPSDGQIYTFQFATNIPCIEEPVVEYEGKTYQTVQIYSQCWLAENLNAGTMIQSEDDQTDNATIEKYCVNNLETNCDIYGGLYQWDEMMGYTDGEGARGICPPGWHIPTDMEWQVLEGVADTQYGIADTIWTSDYLYRGYDQGLHLKATTGWVGNGNGLDTYDFGAQAGSHLSPNGEFSQNGTYATFWSSSSYAPTNSGYLRRFAYYTDEVHRGRESKNYGFSIRCVRDF